MRNGFAFQREWEFNAKARRIQRGIQSRSNRTSAASLQKIPSKKLPQREWARKSSRVKKNFKNPFLPMAIGVFALFESFHRVRRLVFLLIFDVKMRFFESEMAASESVPPKRLP
jgi:hypothetical protein